MLLKNQYLIGISLYQFYIFTYFTFLYILHYITIQTKTKQYYKLKVL